MGRGDIRSKKGKRFAGSYGKSRLKRDNKKHYSEATTATK